MSLWTRLVAFLGARGHATLDRLEDPRETLEAAYRTQLSALHDVRRGVADVLTSEKRIELETETLRGAVERATASAAEAVARGDDAAARTALEREAFTNAQRERLLGELASLHAQRVALAETAERMQRRVELFRTEKLALGARYEAARATSRAGESVAGLGDDMAEVARGVERARDASRDAQARAAAVTELANAPSAEFGIDATRIDARLAALKAHRPPELPA